MKARLIAQHVRDHNWFAVAVDLLVVVVGILIALQLTAWHEAARDRIRERQYLDRIAAEFDLSIPEIEAGIRLTEERSALVEFLVRAVDDPDVVRADPGRFLRAVVVGGYTFSPYIRSQTFEEIKSAGDLDILEDTKLRFDLTEFYTDIAGYAQWNYIRVLIQTEYMKRSAGILTLEQTLRVQANTDAAPAATVDEAMAAHARMLDHRAFIEWLPMVPNTTDTTLNYEKWLDMARRLRERSSAKKAQEG